LVSEEDMRRGLIAAGLSASIALATFTGPVAAAPARTTFVRTASGKTLFEAYIPDEPILFKGKTEAVIHFTVIGGTAKYFDCTITGPAHVGSAGVCKSPVTYAHLAAGVYTFKVWAVSPRGEDSLKATAYFRIH
jgi:hypothetical protein